MKPSDYRCMCIVWSIPCKNHIIIGGVKGVPKLYRYLLKKIMSAIDPVCWSIVSLRFKVPGLRFP